MQNIPLSPQAIIFGLHKGEGELEMSSLIKTHCYNLSFIVGMRESESKNILLGKV